MVKKRIKEEKSIETEAEKENKEDKGSKTKIFSIPSLKSKKVLLPLIIIAVAVITLLVNSVITGNVSKAGVSGKAVEFFKTYQGVDITVDSIEKVSGLYKLNISLSDGRSGVIFMSKDGEYIGSMSSIKEIEEASKQTEEESQEIPKSDKPKVELFVMSFCPYGNRAEDTMLPVYNLLKDNVEWSIHYIVSVSGSTVNSLHGQPEADEDEREMCVLNEYGIDKWWAFTTYINKNCGSDGSCWENGAKQSQLDVNKIKTCVANKGLSLMKAEEQASDSAGVAGSPTLIINGVRSTAIYQYGNSEAYKKAICSAFNKAPSECSQTLSSSGSSSSTSSSGSCG